MSTSTYEPERFSSPEYLAVLDDEPSSTHIRFATQCLRTMRSEAEAGYPLEVCGLLAGKADDTGWQVTEVRPVANLNTERAADRFQLDPAGYQTVDRELRGTGTEIIGVYHSHPDCPAKPSPTDLESAWEGFAYPIVSVCDGKATDIRCWAVNSAGNRFQSVEIEEAS